MHELIVDNFAGGGGASTGIEQAVGRPVDVAINHDLVAIAMHKVNHPHTRHYCENVWEVDPREVAQGRPVGLCWLSPDCKHFSKAKGGKPVEKQIRALAWVAVRWAATVRPRVIILENVEEFQTWGPVVDGRPCPKRKGRTFRAFVNALKRHGYKVDWRELRACDYGAPTIRKRLFLIARCDGRRIIWPEPTHGDPNSLEVAAGLLQPWRTAAEIIDWNLPCPSIFERKRPLAEATMRRIARGIQRFVIDNPRPYIIKVNHSSDDFRGQPIDEPFQTVTAKNGWGVVSPTLIQTGYGEREGQAPRVPGLEKPLGTVVAGGSKWGLVAAFLAKHFGANYNGPGVSVEELLHTITATDHHALVASHITKLYGTSTGHALDEPLHTVTAASGHLGEVRAFLLKYYGEGVGQRCDEPAHTITSKHRLGLVTIHGESYQIVDIGMRMLEPHELFAAQGFPADYIIDRGPDGRRLSKAAQVALCGNAVPPPFAKALVEANLPEMCRVGTGEKVGWAV